MTYFSIPPLCKYVFSEHITFLFLQNFGMMALFQIPLFRERHPLDSIFDDIFDWTPSPRCYRIVQYPRRSKGTESEKCSKTPEDVFKVSLDVKNYKPDEIMLKVDGDKLLVKGKHRKESEYGFESSEFERAYTIPSDVDVKGFTSRINDTGVLVIEAPKIKQDAIQQADQAIQQDDDKFKAVFNVNDYNPDDVSVKVQGNHVIVRGEQKSENKGDEETYFQKRQFIRRFTLPETANPDTLRSKWTKDGKLVIEAEKCPAIEPEARQLEIQHDVENGEREEKEE